MGGVCFVVVAGFHQWPWTRSNLLTASRLIVTRLTHGTACLFLMWGVSFLGHGQAYGLDLTQSKACLFLTWGVSFLGKGRCFCVLMDLSKVKFINCIQIG
jgi:hypothetical protein